MTTSPLLIAPSVLAADFGHLAQDISDLEAGGADLLHIDVMDGSFVPPISFGDAMVSTARTHSNLPLETHLMTVTPERHFEAFAKAGSFRIIIHQETCPHLHRSLGELRSLGVKAGVAINPGTPVEIIFPVLEVADLVLIMTVNPGWGGQPFIGQSLQKIKALRDEITRQGLTVDIEVDGGITNETARQCAKAGASILVAGSYVFKGSSISERIKSLRI